MKQSIFLKMTIKFKFNNVEKFTFYACFLISRQIHNWDKCCHQVFGKVFVYKRQNAISSKHVTLYGSNERSISNTCLNEKTTSKCSSFEKRINFYAGFGKNLTTWARCYQGFSAKIYAMLILKSFWFVQKFNSQSECLKIIVA